MSQQIVEVAGLAIAMPKRSKDKKCHCVNCEKNHGCMGDKLIDDKKTNYVREVKRS
jgi:hypothetical protein